MTASGTSGSSSSRSSSWAPAPPKRRSCADTRAALDTLAALFAPTRDPAVLVVELEDGTTRSISARPVDVMHDDGEVPDAAHV